MEKLVLYHVSYIIPSINSINMSTIFFKHRFYMAKYVSTLISDQKVIVIFHKSIETLMPNLAFLERNWLFFYKLPLVANVEATNNRIEK